MTDEMQKQLLARLDALAAKLGVAAHYLFALYVRQAYLNGMEYLMLAIVQGALCYWLARTCARMYKARGERYSGEFESWVCFFSALGIILLAICTIFSVTSAMDNILNPQLQAFQNIVTAVK